MAQPRIESDARISSMLSALHFTQRTEQKAYYQWNPFSTNDMLKISWFLVCTRQRREIDLNLLSLDFETNEIQWVHISRKH